MIKRRVISPILAPLPMLVPESDEAALPCPSRGCRLPWDSI